MTISFFSRIFSRWNGISEALRKLEFEIVEPAAEKGAVLQLADERVDALIAARQRVPLMPSCASSTLPFSPRPAQIARNGSRSSRKSGSAANW